MRKDVRHETPHEQNFVSPSSQSDSRVSFGLYYRGTIGLYSLKRHMLVYKEVGRVFFSGTGRQNAPGVISG